MTGTAARSRRGRKAVWLAVAVAIGWLVIGSIAGPLSGKLSEVSTNDNASFLPASAESTLAANEQATFAESTSLPVLIVLAREDGAALTEQDVAAAAAFAESIPGLAVEDATIADYVDPGPIVPFPSQDGKALLINVPLNGDKAGENTPSGELSLAVITESIRAAAIDVPGLQINVTGPAGILTDLIAIFGAIDTTLLGATALIVAIILIFVYRSPFIWVIPLLAALMALSAASAIVYILAKNEVLVLNGQSQGILTVLVFGAGTDYALLTIARYREELHHHAVHTDAIKAAWRGTVEPIVASAATVIIGLMCLLLSELNSNRSLGPVGAAGILGALVVMLTFLPALLAIPSVVLPILALLVPTVIGLALSLVSDIPIGPFAAIGGVLALVTVIAWIGFGIMRIRKPHWGPFSRDKYPSGRWAFWPKVPREDEADERLSGVWSKLADSIGRRPRITWVVTALVMLVFAAFSFTLKADGITTTEAFVNETDSVVGQSQLAEHFPGGLGTPAIIIANATSVDDVIAAATATDGVAEVVAYTGAPPGVPATGLPPKEVDGRVLLEVTLSDAADSPQAIDAVRGLRDNVHVVEGADAIVGGQTASQLDVDTASLHDRNLIIPVVLVVIFLILMLLLRSIAAPVLLIGTVVLSFFATLGVCAIFFTHVFGFAGADTSFPLFAFVFLVALGVDYNIFLMTRVREESIKLGTRPGILKGLTVTGGVITSAGIVLAATFLVLGVLPLVFLRQIGFAVAVGVLLDTFIIRSTLVPALAYDIGSKIWWPSKLAKKPEPERIEEPTTVG
ncbi:MAG: MMPL family transporter [Actinobacteria bacterium]|nr:MMPL family transporter [Actinomycetota bacterium]